MFRRVSTWQKSEIGQVITRKQIPIGGKSGWVWHVCCFDELLRHFSNFEIITGNQGQELLSS